MQIEKLGKCRQKRKKNVNRKVRKMQIEKLEKCRQKSKKDMKIIDRKLIEKRQKNKNKR